MVAYHRRPRRKKRKILRGVYFPKCSYPPPPPLKNHIFSPTLLPNYFSPIHPLHSRGEEKWKIPISQGENDFFPPFFFPFFSLFFISSSFFLFFYHIFSQKLLKWKIYTPARLYTNSKKQPFFFLNKEVCCEGQMLMQCNRSIKFNTVYLKSRYLASVET